MRISLIGGRGFIGSHVAERLRIHNADLLIRNKGSEPQSCHTAVHMFVMNAVDAEAFVRDYASLAERLILISSGDVYRAYGVLIGKEPPPLEPQPLTEDAPLRTSRFPYADRPDYDKIPAEQLILDADPRNQVLRLPAVYGPGDRYHRIGSWLKRFETPPVQISPAFAEWRWTHGYVENVAEAIALLATRPDAPSRIYNVGEAHTPTMLERGAAWAQAAGYHNSIEVAVGPDTGYNFKQNLIMDSTRIRQELGFSETVNEAEALQRSIAWEIDTAYARRPS